MRGLDRQRAHAMEKPSRRIRHSIRREVWPAWVLIFFAAVQDVPWVGVTAVAALSGAALQFQYFSSIGHVPSDLGALTSLAISTSIAAVVMLLVVGIALVLPTVVARMYLDGGPTRRATAFKPLEVLSAQVMGVGLFFVHTGYEKATDCGVPLPAYSYVAAFCAILGTAHLVHAGWRGPASSFSISISRLWHTILIGVAALVPFFALLPLQGIVTAEWADLSVLLLSMWLLLLAANAAITRTDPAVGGVVISGLGAAIMLYVAAPLAFDKTATVSAVVAEAIGVRSQGQVTLLLSQRACELVRAAKEHSNRRGEAPTECTDSEANVALGLVLSNVGSRWVLGIGGRAPQYDELRVTVPADGVHLATTVEEDRRKHVRCTPGK
jgi:hypothetical protein